ncbi:hypothetical protein C900_05553 [Fulvivirga imtechensis AK7]|uniref:microbial collagenase n=1 Tax=Fulvivirga imtechensis AK7 TaxID=1237149 RepID=L8JJL6_9BACT|nr:GEVED domain-containing protein [Fulvivirga imtechensis]ELR68995.1 hypothetical protein C900_05553 [Fulvivirga imtechensis AK7]
MLKQFYKCLLSIILLSVAGYTQGQIQVPHDPHDHNDFCSRMNKSKNHGVAEPSIKIGDHTRKSSTSRTTATCYDAAGWASLGSSALVGELKQNTNSDCFSSFFAIESNYAPSIFSNANIEAVANELYNLSASYDGTKSSGLYGLVYYLHAAGYQDFYNDGVSMNITSINRYIQGCEALTSNPNLFLTTKDALDILDEYLILLDFDGLRHKTTVLNTVKRVMQDLVVNKVWKQVSSNDIRTYAGAANRIFFLMFRGVQDNDYVNAINGNNTYFELLRTIALDTELQNNDELAFMTLNAAGELARMAGVPTLLDDTEAHLAQIAQNSARLSPMWLKAIEAMNEYGNCAAYSLCEDMEQLQDELDQMLFPNTYTFDDGKMIVRTPLIEEEVQGLYHAAKQVKNQFFRMLQTDEPVAGDPNDTLRIVVFGSKQEYDDYVTYLFGIGSDNGGMYIESRSTFYTWDRTVGVESSLSLEALFRHEYVHYLQGRYLIPGFWGESEIYNNSRLVWYEEGMAEFFAGSTETEGIRLLASNARNTQNSAGNWPSLNTVFNSSYTSGNFHHYHYGNMIWYHWYVNDFAKLKTFFELTRNNDIAGFDNLVDSQRYNGQQAFTDFLNQVANGTVQGWEPETNWLDDDYLAIGSENDIENEFTAITGITASASIEATALNRRFKLTGSLTGLPAANNNTDAAKAAGAALDNILIQLRGKPMLNNFTYSIGYFKNLSHSSASTTADFVITGPLRDAGIPDTNDPEFSADHTVTMTGGNVTFTSESSGYVRSLQWSFPGGSPSSVTNEVQPTITYAQPGIYDVALTTTGSTGSVTETKSAFIKVYEKSNVVYCAAAGNRSDNYATRVTLGSIDHTSGHQAYNDFTSLVTELVPGATETLTIGTKNGYWDSNGVGAWIDWNADGDFDDAGEEIYNQFGAGPYTTIVNVPANATPGVTRMRIRVAYGDAGKIIACGNDDYIGEVEDFSIVIPGNNDPVSYCSSASGRSTYEHIANVQVGSFSNPSGASNYTDFTHLTVSLTRGNNPVTLTPGFSGSPYNERFRVWIDYNQNGDFTDDGELVFASSLSSSAVSGNINVPASALEGNTRMRVSMRYARLPEACGTFDDGEVEDYTVNISNSASVDAPGALTAMAASSNSVTLTWTDLSDNEDGFVVERAGDNFSVITSLSANSTSYTDTGLNPDVTYSYRVRARSGSTYSTYSNIATVTTPALNYCTVGGDYPSGQYIANVEIGAINNNSAYASAGYSDYSDQQSDISGSANLIVTPHNTWAGTQAKAWADWNRDGDFDDSGEEVLSATGAGGSYSSTIVVPSGTTSGPVRLRVRVAYGETPTPCGSIYFSETEDYTIDVNSNSTTTFSEPSANAPASEMTIFPNPAYGGQFSIIYAGHEDDLEISVYTLQGKVIHQQIISHEAGYNAMEIKLNDKVNGTYLVQVKSLSKNIVRKIIFE